MPTCLRQTTRSPGWGARTRVKFCAANVQLAGSRIVARKASLSVNIVNQVGTVCFRFRLGAYRGNDGQNLATLYSGEGASCRRLDRIWADVLAEHC
jgi:hypothetical protein